MKGFVNRLSHDCLACVASVSVRFRSKERETRVKMTQAKEWGGAGARFISRAAKAENPVPYWSFFAPKPNGIKTLATQANDCRIEYRSRRFDCVLQVSVRQWYRFTESTVSTICIHNGC